MPRSDLFHSLSLCPVPLSVAPHLSFCLSSSARPQIPLKFSCARARTHTHTHTLSLTFCLSSYYNLSRYSHACRIFLHLYATADFDPRGHTHVQQSETNSQSSPPRSLPTLRAFVRACVHACIRERQRKHACTRARETETETKTKVETEAETETETETETENAL